MNENLKYFETLLDADPHNGMYLDFYSSHISIGGNYRYQGYGVRPVLLD